MISCSNIEIRRCRPQLGTFVEITASGLNESNLQDAVNKAFEAIERIQNLLSVHDPASEISLLNREAASHPVTVSTETFKILRYADRLAVKSAGAFDYTVAPTLARWKMLPAHLNRKDPGDWRDIVFLSHRTIRFLRPLALDLSGIAKGFAVDAAIEVLAEHGVEAAVVNAGGDLRVFGPQPSTVHLRHPSHPRTFTYAIRLRHSALATSSPCFTEQDWNGQRVSHLVNPDNDAAITGNLSVTVRADKCWLADALTKVVLNAPQCAESLLAKYQAQAYVFTA